MSKNGDWERPEKESIILVVGSEPDKDAPVVKLQIFFNSVDMYKKKSEFYNKSE